MQGLFLSHPSSLGHHNKPIPYVAEHHSSPSTFSACIPLYRKMFIGGLNWDTTDGEDTVMLARSPLERRRLTLLPTCRRPADVL